LFCPLVIVHQIVKTKTHNRGASETKYGASGDRRASDNGGDCQDIEAD